MTKTIYTNRCNCDDSIALEKELFAAKLLIQELNKGRDPDLPITYLSDGSAIMYPVEVVKYRKAMADNEDMIKAIIDFNSELVESKTKINALVAKVMDLSALVIELGGNKTLAD